MIFDQVLQKNILWTVGSRYGSQALLVFSTLILARYLGSVGFGEYAFISAIVMIGNAISTFGTDMVLIRRISSNLDYSDFLNALGIQLMISLGLIIVVFIVHFFHPFPETLLIYCFALIPLSFFTMSTIALRGAQEMQLFSLSHFAMGVMQFTATIILVINRWNVLQLAFLLLCVHMIAAMFGLFLCKNQIKHIISSSSFSWAGGITLLKASSGLALIGTLRLVYEKIAISIFPFISTVADTGLFSASLRVMDAAKLGHQSALTAMYPSMAHDNNVIANQNAARLLLLVAGFASMLLFLFSKQIVFILFGVQYLGSVEALRVLAWILVPYFIVSYYSLAFIARDVEVPVLRALVMSVLVMLTLLVKLNSLFSLRGAAISLLLTEIFHACLLWIQWRYYAFSKLSK